MTNPDIFKINRQGRQPLYDLIEQNFRDLISSDILQPGETIPSEWDLSKLYGVSRLTVRHALDNLSRQGWLNRRHGVGTFVAHPSVAQISLSRLSFTEQMKAIGLIPSSRQLSLNVIPASEEVAGALGLQQSDPVVEIQRVRLADGEPILLETAYLSQQRFPDLAADNDFSALSLYEYLSTRYQITVAVMDQTVEPTLLTKEQARHLDAVTGQPAILSKVISFNGEGEPIEFSWSVARGDKSRFYFRFRRGENELK